MKKVFLLFIVLALINNNKLCSSIIGSNTIAPKWSFESTTDLDDLILELKEFSAIYEQRPIKVNGGGMRSIAQFWVWYIVKKIQPDLIVESGVWKGQSTWILEQAAPNAKIISIDPFLSRRKYISTKVTYHTEDFSKVNFGDLSDLNTCCFFDDHQDALSRVIQAHEKGFKHLIFDDNYPPGKGSHITLEHCLANGEFKKIESLIASYQILPQLIGTTINLNEDFEIYSLNLQNSAPYLDIHKQNAHKYRMTTHVELHHHRTPQRDNK